MIIGFIEHEQGVLSELSLQMLTLARRLAGQLNVPLQALLIGTAAQPAASRLQA